VSPQNPEFWGRLVSIVLIDLTLASDNALVIALAVRSLPRNVQAIGAICGSLGAIVLRIAFTLAAAFLLRLSGVQILAAALLLWIAFRLVQPPHERGHQVREAATLLEALWVITLADVAMSFDNVLAIAAAAAGDLPLIVIGIALSLPLVVWGSGILARLMTGYPWIVWVGAAVLGHVAGQMSLRDPLVEKWLNPGVFAAVECALPLGLGLCVMLRGWWLIQPGKRFKKIPRQT
jgi:YjbE family integral membrane protein